MREIIASICISGLASFLIACGGGNPAPSPQPSTLATGDSTPVAVLPPLEPMGEPDGLISVLRWKNPRAAIETSCQWAGLPRLGIDAIFKTITDEDLLSVVDIDSPVGLVVVADPNSKKSVPEPFVGFSVGLRSV
ncbi:MAG: hypothetical protein FWD57_16810, partial [Polyangiaceae bacterium]|nr:hypothetical protein [Polyangiaceae bacterium]